MEVTVVELYNNMKQRECLISADTAIGLGGFLLTMLYVRAAGGTGAEIFAFAKQGARQKTSGHFDLRMVMCRRKLSSSC